MGTARLCLENPGGGEGESLLGTCAIFSPFPIVTGSVGLSTGLVGSKTEEKCESPVV